MMTIQELYKRIGGDYDQAISVLRLDKLIDKHIKKFITNGVVEGLLSAADNGDPTEIFETSHAVKGVCSNLGLTKLSAVASDITEEFRPGNVRKMSDEEVKTRIEELRVMYDQTVEGIKTYEDI